jgi:hypothetical protein
MTAKITVARTEFRIGPLVDAGIVPNIIKGKIAGCE